MGAVEPGPPRGPVGVLTRRAIPLAAVEAERTFRPHIYWYLSFRCNLACKHCSVFSSPWVDTSGDLSTDDCMRVVDQMADLGVGCAMLTGGEVLLRPDALDIMRALADRGVPIGLESNGLRFDDAFVALARGLQGRQMFQMTVSLDGGTALTHEALRGLGSFSRTVAGLRFIRDGGVRCHIQCVLNRSNYHTIPHLYRLATELYPGVVMVQFAFLNAVGRGIELSGDLGMRARDLETVFDLIARHRGDYPGETLVKGPPALVPPRHLATVFQHDRTRKSVSCQFPLLGVLPNGDVTICAVSRNNESLRFGNIRDISLRDVWQRTRMDMLRSRYVGAEHLAGICGDCVWKYKCKGGCRAWAYEEGGDFDAPLPICGALEEAGEFPAVYRISQQNAAMTRGFQALAGDGCGCQRS